MEKTGPGGSEINYYFKNARLVEHLKNEFNSLY